jgi:hypothetical protein
MQLEKKIILKDFHKVSSKRYKENETDLNSDKVAFRRLSGAGIHRVLNIKPRFVCLFEEGDCWQIVA